MSDSGSEGDQLGSSPPNDTAAAVMQNPQLLAALQGGLSRLIGQQSGYIQSLPKAVKRRLKALKNIQVEYCKVEGEFYERVHALECEFAERFKPLFEKRKNIVNGQYEPTDEESHWLSDEEEEGGEDKEEKDEGDVSQLSDKTLSSRQGEVKEKVKIDEEEKLETTEIPDDVKGIPEFWLTAMKNIEMLAEMIQEHDEPILKHLLDIRVVFTGPDSNVDTTQYPQPTPMGFVLEYHFSPNPFFTNSVLTKSYKMKCEPDDDDPFSFEGPEIISTSGCHIDWKKGKNVTQKVVKKKQKKKGSAGKQTRFVSKTIKNDSFFNFFAPPEVPEDEADMDEETEALLSADFEIGHFFRERIIPKAVLYFTGEALEEEFEEEEEESEAEEGDGEEDEDEDPDYQPPPDGEKPPECTNQ